MESTVIYADILFFINFLMDGICLCVSLVIAGKPFRLWRFLLACAAGGVYSVFAIGISVLPTAISLSVHIVAALVICFICLPKPSFRDVAGLGALFFLCNALLGGILTAIYSVCGRFALYRGVFYAELSAPSLLIWAAVAGTAVLFAVSRSKAKCRASHADVDIEFRGERIRLFCLCDSGSLLRCPYTGLPVLTVRESAVAPLFGEGLPEELEEGLRFIPAKGIGGDCLLPSFLPEKARVRSFGEHAWREVRLCVAVDKTKNAFGGCDGIIPSVLI